MAHGDYSLLGVALLSTILISGDAVASSANGESSESAPTPTATERADDALGTIEVRSIRVQRWLLEARADKNVARMRCLDRLLSQAHAVERQARRETRRVAHAHAHGASDTATRHLARLDLFEERSQILAEEAYWCGKERSRRPKVPTTYRVRVIRPKLPEMTVRPSSTAAAWR